MLDGMTIAAAFPTGTPIAIGDLLTRGFGPHDLRFRTSDFAAGHCEWDTMGEVPEVGGLYTFVIHAADRSDAHRVTYVGLTGNLWMVTKGRLPDGSSRPAQRYGRHKYAGATRSRVNGLVAAAKLRGHEVVHWLSPRPVPLGVRADVFLKPAEEELIRLWRLRETGWNRG
jgi:hypothetical protein